MPVILALWEVEEGRSLDPRSLRPAWATWQNHISAKKKRKKKISQAWWCAPVVPATFESKVGRSPESEEVEAAVVQSQLTVLQPG